MCQRFAEFGSTNAAGSTRGYGELRTELQRLGRRVAEPDLRIAANALARDATLVTGGPRRGGLRRTRVEEQRPRSEPTRLVFLESGRRLRYELLHAIGR